MFYDIQLDNVTGVESLVIEFRPAVEDKAIYHWNGGNWVACSDQEYDQASGCTGISGTSETTPKLVDLCGLPFASGSRVPVGGEAYPVNKLLILMPWIAIGMAIIAVTTVILRRRRAQGEA